MTSKYFIFDFETHLIEPGNVHPKPVLMTYAKGDFDKEGPRQRCNYQLPDKEVHLVMHEDARRILRDVLEDTSCHIYAHNIAYDILVAYTHYPELKDLIIEAYVADRFHDTMINGMLNAQKAGEFMGTRFNLNAMCVRNFGVELLKDVKDRDGDVVRLSFGKYDQYKAENIPELARKYAVEDTLYTYYLARYAKWHQDEPFQTKASIALARMGGFGVKTDQKLVKDEEKRLSELIAVNDQKLLELGFRKANPPAVWRRIFKKMFAEKGIKLTAKDYNPVLQSHTGFIEEYIEDMIGKESVNFLKTRQLTPGDFTKSEMMDEERVRSLIRSSKMKNLSKMHEGSMSTDTKRIKKLIEDIHRLFRQITPKTEKGSVKADADTLSGLIAACKPLTEGARWENFQKIIKSVKNGDDEPFLKIFSNGGVVGDCHTLKDAILAILPVLDEKVTIMECSDAHFYERYTFTNFTRILEEIDLEMDIKAVLKGFELKSESDKASKILTTYINALKPIINPSYNVLVRTGRTSCRGTSSRRKTEPSSYSINVQNLPRGSKVRECIIPRRGHVFIQADYSTLELVTLADSCYRLFGYSHLGEIIKSGKDVHSVVGHMIYNFDHDATYHISFEEFISRKKEPAIKQYRQLAKAFNFGVPGGGGAATLTAYAAGYGVDISEEQSMKILEFWKNTFTEIAELFNYINNSMYGFSQNRVANITLPRGNRSQDGLHYSQGANYLFQGVAADVAKQALIDLFIECEYDKTSVLYGSRPLLFIHDEIIMETRNDTPEMLHAKAMRLKAIMENAGPIICPSMPFEAEPALIRKWYKGADPVYTEEGLLTFWEPNDG